jgi:hypothetical protein
MNTKQAQELQINEIIVFNHFAHTIKEIKETKCYMTFTFTDGKKKRFGKTTQVIVKPVKSVKSVKDSSKLTNKKEITTRKTQVERVVSDEIDVNVDYLQALSKKDSLSIIKRAVKHILGFMPTVKEARKVVSTLNTMKANTKQFWLELIDFLLYDPDVAIIQSLYHEKIVIWTAAVHTVKEPPKTNLIEEFYQLCDEIGKPNLKEIWLLEENEDLLDIMDTFIPFYIQVKGEANVPNILKQFNKKILRIDDKIYRAS